MPPFVLFGRDHLIVLCLSMLLAFLLAGLARSIKKDIGIRILNVSLILALIINKIVVFKLAYKMGELTLQNTLPLHLCDIATFLSILTLLMRWQWSYELTYFWGLAGTFQAILTPDIEVGFPHPRFITFFISHCGVVIVLIYLTIGLKMRPTVSSLWRAYGWIHVYALGIGLINIILGTNYGYLCHKPHGASLLDFLGSWPFYLGSMSLLALISFWFYYLPFGVRDLLTTKFKS